MTDVTRLNPRLTQQDRALRRRDSIVPNRRNTDNGQRRIYNDEIRAPRGSGQAQAVKEALGIVDEAVGAWKDVNDLRYQRREEQNEVQAYSDFSHGEFDAEKYKKSISYRAGYSTLKVQSEFSKHKLEMDEEIRGIIESDDDPDLDNRKSRVAALIEQGFGKFALDPDGKVVPLGSPEAAGWLASEMSKTREEMRARSFELIEERHGTQALTYAATGVRLDIMAGGKVDIETRFSAIPATVSNQRKKETLIAVVNDVADELEEQGQFQRSLEIREQLLYSVKTPAAGVQAVALPPSEVAVTSRVFKAPTGRLPLDGQITTSFAAHGARGSVGLDIDGRMGDPIEAPAGGRVKAVGHDAKSGNYVIIDHGNGVESSYSHLSKANFKRDQEIQAGDVLGLVGNTGRVRSRSGDGSHLHYRVKVDGKDVDPQAYRFADSAPSGSPSDAAPARQKSDPVEDAKRSRGGERVLPDTTTGAWSLSPTERAAQRDRIDAARKRIEATQKKEEDEKHRQGFTSLLGRTVGIGGSSLTRTDVLNAYETGEIDVDGLVQLTNLLENEADREEARADRLEARAIRDAQKRGRDRADGLLGDVYGLKVDVSAAQSRMNRTATLITDPDERREYISTVQTELDAVVQMREKSPEYVNAQTKFDLMEQDFYRKIPPVLPPGMTQDRARQTVKEMVDRFRIQLGKEALRKGDIVTKATDYEGKMRQNFFTAFPPNRR